MEGHITKKGNRWYVVLDLPRREDGKRRQKWSGGFRRKKDAERERARLVHEMNTGAFIEASKTTLGEYIPRWLETARTTVSPKTYERYADILLGSVKPALGHIPLAKLSPLHVQAYEAELLTSGRRQGEGGLSPRTVLHHHRVLSRALGQAVKWQMLVRNPCDAVDAPKPERTEMNSLDTDGIERLLKVVAGLRIEPVVRLALGTGMRRGELLGLKWSDIDLKGGRIAVRRTVEHTAKGPRLKDPKTSRSRRTVALSPSAVALLKSHRVEQAEYRLKIGGEYEDNNLVFPDELGGLWQPNKVTTAFVHVARKAKLDCRFHDLRHTHATMLLAEGVHPKIVSERLGHGSIAITMDTYSHVLPTMQEEAAARVDAALGL